SEESVQAAAEAALRWLKSEQGVDPARVILLGWSLGSGVATEMAKRQLGARLVLVAPFTSVADMCRRFLPFLPARVIQDRFDNLSKAPAIGIPVLIIHGTEDGTVPFEMGRRLAGAFPQARLVPVEGGEHNDLFTVHALELRNALAPFVKF